MPSPRVRSGLFLLGVGVFAASVLAHIQYATPSIPEFDGYYHIKLAQLIRENGFLRSFPWLPLTTFSERYSDMHLLFHYLLVPFTFFGLMEGAKLYAVLSSTLVVLALAWVLQREKVPGALLWILALFSSEALLYRLAIPRTGQLSILFLLAGLGLLWSRRSTWLFVLSFVYTWLYFAFPVLLAFAVFHTLSCLLLKEKADLRSLLFIVLGMGAGMLLNPYFPDNAWYFYTQTFQISLLQQIPIAEEWYPWDTWQLFSKNALIFVSLFVAVLLSLLKKGSRDAKTITLFLVTVFFLLLTLKSRRFVEYFVPFGMMFTAFSLRDIVQAGLVSDQTRRWFRPFLVLVLILVGVAGLRAVKHTSEEVRVNTGRTMNARYEGCAEWLEQNTPPDSMVFHGDWDDFAVLFFFNSHNRYTTGLDPNFLFLKDPKLWHLYTDITQGRLERPSGPIRQNFGAEYIFSDRRHTRFLENLRDEGEAVLAYEDPACLVYNLRDSSTR